MKVAAKRVVPGFNDAHDGRWAEKRIGPERAKTTYAFTRCSIIVRKS